jgi:hypothetical protein
MTDGTLSSQTEAAQTGAGEAAADAATPQRPDHIPEKFWDAEAGTVRTEALARSYVELERKLGRMVPLPDEDASPGHDRLLAALGRPSEPAGYAIATPHPLLESDPELNARLHAAGFTQKQAQLVYELAAERMVPMITEGLEELEAGRQIERLKEHFGGAEAWRESARQLRTWAVANLPQEVLGTLAASYEGVLALHQMMKNAEPRLVAVGGEGARGLDEKTLHDMMRDPRYWRDRDPQFIAQVSAGFRRLYPD